MIFCDVSVLPKDCPAETFMNKNWYYFTRIPSSLTYDFQPFKKSGERKRYYLQRVNVILEGVQGKQRQVGNLKFIFPLRQTTLRYQISDNSTQTFQLRQNPDLSELPRNRYNTETVSPLNARETMIRYSNYVTFF